MFVANEDDDYGAAAEGKASGDGGGGGGDAGRRAKGEKKAAPAAAAATEEVPWARVRALVREYVSIGARAGWAASALGGRRPREIAAFVHDVAAPGYALGPGAGPDADPIIFSSSSSDDD